MESSIVLKTVLFAAFLFTVCAQNRPPSISIGPLKKVFILYGSSLSSPLSCNSSGTPAPVITWYKNTQPVNLNAQNSVSDDGTLTMQVPEEGYYQCSANNIYGTAWSNVAWLRRLRTDVGATPQASRTVSVGDTLSLPCTLAPNQIIIPAASYKWQTVPSVESTETRDIILDKRIQMDNNGTLKFASVVVDDYQNGRFYRCQLTNVESNILETSVAFTKVSVTTTNPVRPTQMTNLFSYSWPSLALEREKVSLRCFFGGASDITVTWKNPKGQDIFPVVNRYQIDYSQLTISNVQKSDEGAYTCTGVGGGLPSASATINLQVESAPYFASVIDGPRDINVTTGENVVINCNAYANPPATVSWFLNGEPFGSGNLRSKFQLSSDMKTLTISNVCKSCTEGIFRNSDLMVIQCNASNVHGYVYGNGYINVLDPTVITVPPSETVLNFPNPIVFTCNATTDVATQVNYIWSTDSTDMYTGQINTSLPGTLYINIAQDKEEGREFLGTWTCNATNGLSSSSKSAKLSTYRVAGASIPGWWWIPLLVLLLLLLLIALILFLCWCMYRNRGDAYPVDEEERKGGNDPVKELHEIGFHDFQRPVDAPDGVILHAPLERGRHGPGSISSSIGKAISEDEMSLDNYSNVNHGKFTEDGSFIGQYNPNRRNIQMTQPGIPESSA